MKYPGRKSGSAPRTRISADKKHNAPPAKPLRSSYEKEAESAARQKAKAVRRAKEAARLSESRKQEDSKEKYGGRNKSIDKKENDLNRQLEAFKKRLEKDNIRRAIKEKEKNIGGVLPKSGNLSNNNLDISGRIASERGVKLEDIAKEFYQCATVGDNRRALVLLGVHSWDINAKVGPNGTNALHAASAYGRRDIVELILSTDGCDPTVRDDYGRTASEIAIESGQPEMFQDALVDFECQYMMR